MWCNEDDSRERAAYVCLNKSQLNQYCTTLAMRTLGSYACSAEVEETELGVVRRTGRAGVFVISCMQAHRCRIKTHAFVFTNVDACVRPQRCRAATERNVQTCLSGRDEKLMFGIQQHRVQRALRLLSSPGCQIYRPDLTTRLSEAHNHLKYLQQQYDFCIIRAQTDILWFWCHAFDKYWQDSVVYYPGHILVNG